MSLTTRCPACATQFKVVPDQLRISAGWVRCGHCGEVFDASLRLVQAPAEPRAAAASPGASAGALKPAPPTPAQARARTTAEPASRPPPHSAFPTIPAPVPAPAGASFLTRPSADTASTQVPPRPLQSPAASAPRVTAPAARPVSTAAPSSVPRAEERAPEGRAHRQSDDADLGFPTGGTRSLQHAHPPPHDRAAVLPPDVIGATASKLQASLEREQAPWLAATREESTEGGSSREAAPSRAALNEQIDAHALRALEAANEDEASGPDRFALHRDGEPAAVIASETDFQQWLDALEAQPPAPVPISPTARTRAAKAPDFHEPDSGTRKAATASPQGAPGKSEAPGATGHLTGERLVATPAQATARSAAMVAPSPPPDTTAGEVATPSRPKSAAPREPIHPPDLVEQDVPTALVAGSAPVVVRAAPKPPGADERDEPAHEAAPSVKHAPPRPPPLSSEPEAEQLEPPRFVTQAERRATWRSRPVRVLMGIAASLLAALLLGQVALARRDWLAARLPQLAPALQALCKPLDCRVGPLQQLDAVVIDGSAFNRIDSARFRFSITLRNMAPTAVATPALELTLTDADDRAVVRRVVLPAELGAPAALAPRGDFAATRALVAAAGSSMPPGVVGYRLVAFYP